LACKVLQFINLYQIFTSQNQQKDLNKSQHEKLNLAVLQFFQQFRKVYIGEQAQRSSKVFFILFYFFIFF